MLQNRAFWKALHSLTHPISLIAILTLILNDHWLRYAYPSWVFGKLGDFTWLIFAPFLAALLFAWIIPKQTKNQAKWVGWMSVALVGMWFALAKTNPAVHSVSLDVLKFISGWQPTLRMDSSDLITLTALPISAWVWNQADEQPKNIKAWASVALGLGVLATAATSSMPSDWGITCLYMKNNNIYALAKGDLVFHRFESQNSGATWTEITNDRQSQMLQVCPSTPLSHRPDEWTLKAGSKILRITRSDSVEISVDSGKTWRMEFDLSVASQDVRRRDVENRFYDKSSAVHYEPWAFDALFDKSSGNILIAMGHNGILVRSPDANYSWIQVGPYYFETITTPNKMASMLRHQELWIAISIFFLAFAMFHTLDREPVFPLDTNTEALLIVFWCFQFLIIIFLAPTSDSFFSFESLGILISGFIGLLSLTIGTLDAISANRPYRTLQVLFAAFLVACCFVFPYVLWARGTIYTHESATGYAAVLLIMGLIGGYIYLNQSRIH